MKSDTQLLRSLLEMKDFRAFSKIFQNCPKVISQNSTPMHSHLNLLKSKTKISTVVNKTDSQHAQSTAGAAVLLRTITSNSIQLY